MGTSRQDGGGFDGQATPDADVASSDSPYGRWPQRLLRVDDNGNILRSCEWQPGNIYDGEKEPKYNVLSYTWGRFKLPDGKRPDVKAIDIQSVPWKDALPRIDPERHFSVDQFRWAIMHACDGYEEARGARGSVKFLWLDVACIDQENDGPKMLEVGRQAVIFQHAESACIWLANSSFERLLKLFEELFEAYKTASDLGLDGSSGDPDPAILQEWLDAWLPRLFENVRYILTSEPWFTSLWTLQEAYLRPLSCILCQDGRPIPAYNTIIGDHERFKTITLAMQYISKTCHRGLILDSANREEIKLLLEQISRTGLLEVAESNPLLLFKAASFRQVYDKLDRVYGIMQVFGFKVGESDPDRTTKRGLIPSRRRPRLSELEMELSQKILEAYPVLSHLNIFTAAPKPGQAWRLSSSIEVPAFSQRASDFLFVRRGPHASPQYPRHQQHTLYRFSTTTDITPGLRQCPTIQGVYSSVRNSFHKPITWCHFTGKVCPFVKLSAAWKEINDQAVCGEELEAVESGEVQEIALDIQKDTEANEWIIPYMPEFPLLEFEIPRGRHDELATKLIERFHGQELIVLCLGTQDHPIASHLSTTYGLILIRRRWRGVLHWHRLGVVSWEIIDWPESLTSESTSILKVEGGNWVEMEGLYG